MKLDKYFQKRGYSNKRFRDIRTQINRFLMEEYGVGETVSRRPNKAKKCVQFAHPEQIK